MSLPHPSALERHASQGTLHELVSAWGARADSAPPPASPLEWLACALRLDLALLRERPGLLLPCLWHRLWWVGSPEAEAFYGSAPAPGEGAAAALRPWLEAWRASRPASAAWLRSLRPPERALGGALLEEWRGHFESVSSLAMAEGGRYVLLRCEGQSGAPPKGLRWCRRTGLVEASAPPSAPPKAKSVVRSGGPGGGNFFFEWGGRRLGPLSLDDFPNVFAAQFLPEERTVLGYGYDLDGGGFVVRYEVKPPHRFWPAKPPVRRWLYTTRDSVHIARASADGGTVVVCEGASTVTLLDAQTGEPRVALKTFNTNAWLSADGALLFTLAPGLVRVWSVARLDGDRRLHGCHRGWIHGAFSPSGGRVLTGSCLCDARTGALVARLEVDGTGYLEGGPPATGRALLDDYFIEISPQGLQAFHGSTGELAHQRPVVSLGVRHVVAFSPDGRLYAFARQSYPGAPPEADLVRVARVDGEGAPVELDAAGVSSLAFAPDGSALAAALADGRLLLWAVPSFELRWSVQAHDEFVEGVAFDCSGELLVSGGHDGSLRATQTADGSPAATRHVTKDETDSLSYHESVEPVPIWKPSPRALVALDGWGGLRTRPEGAAPLAGLVRDGVFELVDPADRIVAAFPSSDQPVGSPDGRCWAGGTTHVVLEGWGESNECEASHVSPSCRAGSRQAPRGHVTRGSCPG